MKNKKMWAAAALAAAIACFSGCKEDPDWTSVTEGTQKIEAEEQSDVTEKTQEIVTENQSDVTENKTGTDIEFDIETLPEKREAGTNGETDMITVYVCGAVADPGVYELPAGSRVVRAIEAAGGLLPEADLFLVNQAKRLEDGEQIRILTQEEAQQADLTAGAESGTGNPEQEKKVNINTADAGTLMTLPGIGEAKADAIIEYRESSGGFQCIEDIMNITGIKEAVFSKIKDKITVS